MADSHTTGHKLAFHTLPPGTTPHDHAHRPKLCRLLGLVAVMMPLACLVCCVPVVPATGLAWPRYPQSPPDDRQPHDRTGRRKGDATKIASVHSVDRAQTGISTPGLVPLPMVTTPHDHAQAEAVPMTGAGGGHDAAGWPGVCWLYLPQVLHGHATHKAHQMADSRTTGRELAYLPPAWCPCHWPQRRRIMPRLRPYR